MGPVEVLLDDELETPVPEGLPELVRRAAEMTLSREHGGGPEAVTVFLTGDGTLRQLNLEFNGEDSVTDVLSFNETEGWRDGQPPETLPAGGFELGPRQVPRLGDIAVSVEQAARQAEAAGHSLEREVALLTVHGVLHLLGFDHAEPKEERVMSSKTGSILQSLL